MARAACRASPLPNTVQQAGVRVQQHGVALIPYRDQAPTAAPAPPPAAKPAGDSKARGRLGLWDRPEMVVPATEAGDRGQDEQVIGGQDLGRVLDLWGPVRWEDLSFSATQPHIPHSPGRGAHCCCGTGMGQPRGTLQRPAGGYWVPRLVSQLLQSSALLCWRPRPADASTWTSPSPAPSGIPHKAPGPTATLPQVPLLRCLRASCGPFPRG